VWADLEAVGWEAKSTGDGDWWLVNKQSDIRKAMFFGGGGGAADAKAAALALANALRGVRKR
jgi:hypothetical protein